MSNEVFEAEHRLKTKDFNASFRGYLSFERDEENPGLVIIVQVMPSLFPEFAHEVAKTWSPEYAEQHKDAAYARHIARKPRETKRP